MTAKEALKLMKEKSFVKWYNASRDNFMYGRYIELLQVYEGRHIHDIGAPRQLITSARVRVNENCTMYVPLKDLYPYYVPDDMIRDYYEKKFESIGRLQRTGLYIRCPRCGGRISESLTENASSRRDGRVLVCPRCAKIEAFCDENDIPDPYTEWWCFCTEDETA